MTVDELCGGLGLWMGAAAIVTLGWVVSVRFREDRQARRCAQWQRERERQAARLKAHEDFAVARAVAIAREEWERADAEALAVDAWVADWDYRFYEMAPHPDGPGLTG